MSRETPQPSDAEWKVLHALWKRRTASARELLEDLSAEGWAYTTLKTMLTRMEQKGLVRESRRGNASLYEPAIERRHAQRDALAALVERVFQGASGPLIAHLVGDKRLSAVERKLLEARLKELEREDGA